jgi:uncharacterized tellurite resistance protein B-like protein
MLDAIKSFFAELDGSPAEQPFDETDQRLAAAALLYHVIAIDGVVSAEERRALCALLARHYQLDGEEVAELLAAAELADSEAVDLYGFTSVLKRRLDADGRKGVIRMMWEMVYADGSMNEFEDNVVWRVAELLGVSTRDRVGLKRAVRGDGD